MKRGAAGGVVAAPIWHDYMKKVLGDTPKEEFKNYESEKTGKAILDGIIEGKKTIKVDKISGLLATEETPKELIEEIELEEHHSILYYIDKKNPLGSIPEKPEKDSQFEEWEEKIRLWSEKISSSSIATIPTEYDNLHKEENKPTIKITSPKNKSTKKTSELISTVSVKAPREIAGVYYYIDNYLVSYTSNYPFALNENISYLNNGNHSLRTRACDDVYNCQEDKIEFNLNLSNNFISQNIDLNLLEPNSGLAVSNFDFPIKIKTQNNNSNQIAINLIDISGNKDYEKDLLDFLEDCRQRSRIMVIIDPSITREDALHKIVPALSSRVHFVRTRGPLHDSNGVPLNYYYIRNPEHIILHEANQSLAEISTHLLSNNPGVHVSVASPLQLLQELFTIKGAGCVVRIGSKIICHSSIKSLNKEKLKKLLESSFQRKLVNLDFMDRATDLYVEENYYGVVLLEPHGKSMYLSKFTVEKLARGEGLAQELWRRISSNHDSIFWRSHVSNPVNHWYEKLADGCHCEGVWKVFWFKTAVGNIPEMISIALKQKEDLEPRAGDGREENV
jgi:hypothetical protein